MKPARSSPDEVGAYAAGMSEKSVLPRWRGINHLALVTTDMDATTRFYHGVLGARLVATIGTPAFRHYFFEIGEENTIAFFEYRDVEIESFAKPAGCARPAGGAVRPPLA